MFLCVTDEEFTNMVDGLDTEPIGSCHGIADEEREANIQKQLELKKQLTQKQELKKQLMRRQEELIKLEKSIQLVIK